jgi:hypothetical protein
MVDYKLQYKKGTARNSLVVFQAVVNRNPAIAGYYKLTQTFEL